MRQAYDRRERPLGITEHQGDFRALCPRPEIGLEIQDIRIIGSPDVFRKGLAFLPERRGKLLFPARLMHHADSNGFAVPRLHQIQARNILMLLTHRLKDPVGLFWLTAPLCGKGIKRIPGIILDIKRKKRHEIREEREDFSSNGLADIADAILSAIGIKDDAMHFIEKEQTTGEHLYTENDVVNVTDILTQNPDKAEDFTANAIELEAIKDKANNIKYDGSTIVNVGEKMTIYEELKSTMIHTAQKGDMTDNFLIGITDNLVENPEMQDALDIFLNLKDNDGKDRFSAKNIFDQSGFMVDKDKATIVSYTGETLYLSKHGNLSGDNIVSISGNITDNPGIRESVHEQLSTGNYTGDELESYTNELAYNTQENNYNSDCSSKNSTSDNVNYCTDSSDTKEKLVAEYNNADSDAKNFFSNNSETDVETTVQETEDEKIEINGNKYNRKAVQQEFYKKYGTVGDTLLSKLEADPKFIETIKQYSGYPVILESIANNPSTVNKLLCATSGLSKNDLAEILPLCTNTQNTNLLISLTEKFGPALAVRYFKTAKDSNNLEQIEFVMSNNTIDGETKKSKIENSCLA